MVVLPSFRITKLELCKNSLMINHSRAIWNCHLKKNLLNWFFHVLKLVRQRYKRRIQSFILGREIGRFLKLCFLLSSFFFAVRKNFVKNAIFSILGGEVPSSGSATAEVFIKVGLIRLKNVKWYLNHFRQTNHDLIIQGDSRTELQKS